MALVWSQEETLWGLRWMHDAGQNSGKSKPGLFSVIGLVGAAGKLGRKTRFAGNAGCWNNRELVEKVFTKLFIYLILCMEVQNLKIKTKNHKAVHFDL